MWPVLRVIAFGFVVGIAIITIVLAICIMLALNTHAFAAPKNDPGPDLPYSCDIVRLATEHIGKRKLEALAVLHGITPKQRR